LIDYVLVKLHNKHLSLVSVKSCLCTSSKLFSAELSLLYFFIVYQYADWHITVP